MIVFDSVWASYGERHVLRGINLDVVPGSITAVVGPSGSGKSTVLRVAMGLMPVDEGRVLIEGEEVQHFSERQWRRVRRKMGMVFQNSALFDSLSVIQNVGFYPYYVDKRPWRLVREQALDMLAELGLSDAAYKMPSQLSGGMQRRVALARALIYRPKILFYDEPTTGLDPLNIDIVSDLIVETADRFGVTSVVVSHDLQAIMRVADEVVVIGEGRGRNIGAPENLLRSTDPAVISFTQAWREQIHHFTAALNGGPAEAAT